MTYGHFFLFQEHTKFAKNINLDYKSSKGEICPSSPPKNEAFGKLSSRFLNILRYISPTLTHTVWRSFHASAACEKQQGSYFTKLLLRRKIRQRSTCTQCTYHRVPEQNPVNKTQATKESLSLTAEEN